jgi:Ala-tRNA(Pro) deacylase
MLTSELDKRNIGYSITTFTAKLFRADQVADELGMHLRQIAKAMLVKLSDGSFVIALVPGDKRLKLSAISALFNNRKAEIAKRQDVVQVTGLPVGAITPLVVFIKTEIGLIVDAGLAKEDKINISSGDLEIGLTVSAIELMQVINPVIADISE